MSTTAYKVYSNLEQLEPKEVYFSDYQKAEAFFSELILKYRMYDGFEIITVGNPNYVEHFEILDICHGDYYNLYLEQIEIRG